MYMTMNRIITSVVIASASLLITASPAFAITSSSSSPSRDDSFDQSTFPCQEDEVLGYAPQFGPDHVGCIHIDDLR